MGQKSSKLPEAVNHFDQLPDGALVDVGTLKALTGKCRNTIGNWVKSGALPQPVQLVGTTRRAWRVGDVRKALGMTV